MNFPLSVILPVMMKKGGPRTALYELCQKSQWPLPRFESVEQKIRWVNLWTFRSFGCKLLLLMVHLSFIDTYAYAYRHLSHVKMYIILVHLNSTHSCAVVRPQLRVAQEGRTRPYNLSRALHCTPLLIPLVSDWKEKCALIRRLHKILLHWSCFMSSKSVGCAAWRKCESMVLIWDYEQIGDHLASCTWISSWEAPFSSSCAVSYDMVQDPKFIGKPQPTIQNIPQTVQI